MLPAQGPQILPSDPSWAFPNLDATLQSALTLLVDQGEILLSSGLVYLDLSFAVDIVRALVDHRLTDQPSDEIRAYVSSAPMLVRDHRSVERLLAALGTMLRSGRLSHELLGFLWRSVGLQSADYEAALAMLQDSGLLVEAGDEAVASCSAVSRQWIMPIRLPCEQPPVVINRWGAATSADGEQLLKVRQHIH